MSEFFFEDLAAPKGLTGVSPSLFAGGGINGWEGIKSSLTEFAAASRGVV
jgi:hypothetical protein